MTFSEVLFLTLLRAYYYMQMMPNFLVQNLLTCN